MNIEIILTVLLLLCLGTISGFLAGLLGIGGGGILVPALYYILKYYNYSENAMHIAAGTSLVTIIFTGFSSGFAHFKHGLVEFKILKNYMPGILLGVVIGTYIAGSCPTFILKLVFASSQLLFGSYLILNINKKAIFNSLPQQPWLTCFSTFTTSLATVMGVGGGVQNVIFMTICNVKISNAIATAAVICPFIALAGCVGFMIIGLSDHNLPPFSIGYVNFSMFICIITTSVITAPIGAKFGHSLPVNTLKKYFSIMTLCIAFKMFAEVIWSSA